MEGLEKLGRERRPGKGLDVKDQLELFGSYQEPLHFQEVESLLDLGLVPHDVKFISLVDKEVSEIQPLLEIAVALGARCQAPGIHQVDVNPGQLRLVEKPRLG